jgi:hypothetical protein
MKDGLLTTRRIPEHLCAEIGPGPGEEREIGEAMGPDAKKAG